MQLSLGILVVIAISNNYVNARGPSKIVGGKSVNIPDIPSIVMIRHMNSFNVSHAAICGGTLITPRHVLTAAHCFRKDPTDPENLRHPRWYEVIAGKNSYRPNAKVYHIEEVYSHPDFADSLANRDGIQGDIAVVKLKEEVRVNRVHRPIKMATEALGNFAKGHIYGWGFPKANTSAISRYLQGLLLIVLDRETCWEYYNTEKISEDELCVVDPRGGSLCDGDSGGPLIVDGKLAGVISSGPTDCSNNIPGYVMSISYYKQWIEDVLKGTAKAITYFAETPADTTYTKPNSQPARKSEQSNQRDELSSWSLLN